MAVSNARAHIAVLMTNIFFAMNFSLVKFISPSLVGPYGLNFLRVSVSIVLFWALWLFSKESAGISKKHLPRFILCGLCGVALNQMLFIRGLTLTSTIHASLLMLCTPLVITLSAIWVLKEKLTWLKLAGLILGVGGASILILTKEGGNSNTSSLRGDLFIVLNAMAYSVYFVMVKPLMQVYPPMKVIRWVFTIGFLFMLPFTWTEFRAIGWYQFHASHFAALASVVICGTFLAYSFNIYGIQHLGAGVTGSYIYTQPVFAALVATLFLGEHFTLYKIIAAVFIGCGVFLVSRRSFPVIQE